jgi:cbb3-type cytochrome oxidase maturation protein
MEVLFIVFPLALLIAAVSVAAFIWAVRRGQMDDLETPAIRMLHDDEDDVVERRPEGDAAEEAGASKDKRA